MFRIAWWANQIKILTLHVTIPKQLRVVWKLLLPAKKKLINEDKWPGKKTVKPEGRSAEWWSRWHQKNLQRKESIQQGKIMTKIGANDSKHRNKIFSKNPRQTFLKLSPWFFNVSYCMINQSDQNFNVEWHQTKTTWSTPTENYLQGRKKNTNNWTGSKERCMHTEAKYKKIAALSVAVR